MRAWWWRSVAACATVLVVAGLVAVFAVAVTADRATAVPLAAEDDGPPAPAPAGTSPDPSSEAPAAPSIAVVTAAPDEGRVASGATTASVATLGWQPATEQRVVEVPPGRFDAVLTRGTGAAVLVGRADPARVPDAVDPASADRAALGAEARRLADAYAEIVGPDADRVATVSDDDRPIADLPTSTAVRRVEGGGADADGAVVRVSTVAAPGRTIALLAVARPGSTAAADAADAGAVVGSLRLDVGTPQDPLAIPGVVPAPAG